MDNQVTQVNDSFFFFLERERTEYWIWKWKGKKKGWEVIEFWSNQWVNGAHCLNIAELLCYFQLGQFGPVRNHPNWYPNRESLVSSVKDRNQLSHHSKPSMSLRVRLDRMGELSLVCLWIALTLQMSKNLSTAWPILLCASFSCSKEMTKWG